MLLKMDRWGLGRVESSKAPKQKPRLSAFFPNLPDCDLCLVQSSSADAVEDVFYLFRSWHFWHCFYQAQQAYYYYNPGILCRAVSRDLSNGNIATVKNKKPKRGDVLSTGICYSACLSVLWKKLLNHVPDHYLPFISNFCGTNTLMGLMQGRMRSWTFTSPTWTHPTGTGSYSTYASRCQCQMFWNIRSNLFFWWTDSDALHLIRVVSKNTRLKIASGSVIGLRGKLDVLVSQCSIDNRKSNHRNWCQWIPEQSEKKIVIVTWRSPWTRR